MLLTQIKITFSMNILVTGCSGFIGSNYCEKLLNNDYNVIGIDNFDPYYDPQIKERNLNVLKSNSNFEFVKTDIRNLQELEQVFNGNDIDKVVHFAAKAGVRASNDFPLEYAQTNIIGTINLLESCKIFDINLFDYAGSSSVYGNDSPMPFTEELPSSKPESPYAATKRSCELFGYVYHSLYGINFTSYRFFSVYGPRGRPDMAVYKFTKNILEDKEILVYGEGTYKRDFTYISDIVDGIFLGIDKKLGYEIFNLGTETPISVTDMVNRLEKLLSKKTKMRYVESPKGEAIISYADISKAKKVLKYSPKISFDQGLKLFVEWYKNKKN